MANLGQGKGHALVACHPGGHKFRTAPDRAGAGQGCRLAHGRCAHVAVHCGRACDHPFDAGKFFCRKACKGAAKFLYKGLQGRFFALLGKACHAGNVPVRESLALKIVQGLFQEEIRVHAPVAAGSKHKAC